MLRRYWVFYLFVGFNATSLTAKLSLHPFISDNSYTLLYFVLGTIQSIISAALLLHLLFLTERRSTSLRPWISCFVALTVSFCLVAAEQGWQHWLSTLANARYLFPTLLVLANLTRFRDHILGWNVYAILGGLFLHNALGSIAHLVYLADLSLAVDQVFHQLGNYIAWLAWIVILLGMWRYDPPRPVPFHVDPRKVASS